MVNGELTAGELELPDVGVTGRSKVHFGPQYTVHIINAMLTENFTFHCKSKDTDLGSHVAEPAEDYYFTSLKQCLTLWPMSHLGFH
ncbi:unnamed protein product [Thlaspi arvense]|uniref:Uncharacterized protein n=1 Tax=Thlaspi arvense TaxID=13288 RepID=A0AAU9RSR0_THLAR|nr:unnamed protein product [Thlaspi arvense]